MLGRLLWLNEDFLAFGSLPKAAFSRASSFLLSQRRKEEHNGHVMRTNNAMFSVISDEVNVKEPEFYRRRPVAWRGMRAANQERNSIDLQIYAGRIDVQAGKKLFIPIVVEGTKSQRYRTIPPLGLEIYVGSYFTYKLKLTRNNFFSMSQETRVNL